MKKLGFEIKKTKNGHISFHNDFNQKIAYEFDKQANEAIKIVRNNTMLPNANLVTLYKQVLFCEKNKLCGDFVKCGV